jgi:DNA adenine methylase
MPSGYLGAKTGSGVFHAIVARMPPHDTYIEAFFGSGAILDRKAAAARTIVLDKDPACVARAADRRDVEAMEGCALEYLAALACDPARLAAMGRVLIYADPPYLLSTRTGRHRYAHELTDADHVRLAGILRRLAELGCAVMISGYPSALYDDLYAGWATHEMQAMTRGGPRTEKLWLSFEPGAPHWHTFAGRDFTDRQRIKRKAERWARMYRALPAGEQLAILAAILSVRDPA